MLQSRNVARALRSKLRGTACARDVAMHGKQIAAHGCHLDSGPASNRIVGDEGGSQWQIPWPVGGVRANASLSRGRVRSGEVRQALLDIAKAWTKLALEVDASEASEPQASIDFLGVFRRTQFLKNG
jgi:hypothetical protein